MYYHDRLDAAQQLVPLLESYSHANCVILAIPRGGVPIAYHIAKHFGFPVDLLMIKKIGHPANPELAIGAVTLEDYIIDKRQGDIAKTYIEKQVTAIRKNLAARYQQFMGSQQPIALQGKTVIVVDDGIATGNTIMASIRILRRQHPAKIVVAVPVAPPDTAYRLRQAADDFICPYTPDAFFGVGYHYAQFDQVADEEVIWLIKDLRTSENVNT